MKESRLPVFGIDLGTTNCCIARVREHGEAEVVMNLDDALTMPSVVAFPSADAPVIGRAARNMASAMPEAVVTHIKRRIGMDPALPAAQTVIGGRTYTPEEISALILRKTINDALEVEGRERGERVRAVITVPAYFGSIPKNNTKNAAELADVELLELVHEPVAAAVAYGAARGEGDRTLLVYDLGGGTFDVTVVRAEGRRVRTVATDGVRLLGGLDWDLRLAQWLAAEFDGEHPGAGPDPDAPADRVRLLETAEAAKVGLSSRSSTTVQVHHGGASISREVTRDAFEAMTADLLEATAERTKAVLAELAGKGIGAIDRVVLVGGSSRMPAIAERLKRVPELGGAEISLHDPDLAVAKGAALLAGMIVEGEQAADLTGAHATGPPGETRLVTMVNAKAIGDVLRDTDTGEDYVKYVIARNSELPFSVEETFYTVEDNQEGARVQIVEERGEPSRVVEENLWLHTGNFPFPRPLPKGAPLHFRYTLDGAGILHVFATEPSTGATWEMTVDRYRKVTDDQMLRLKPVMANVG